ncbi:MAG: hypothetical protein MI757_04355 [Pirellulales bacterium]|nr:hypothetical protein [Pirellulales bacterium]
MSRQGVLYSAILIGLAILLLAPMPDTLHFRAPWIHKSMDLAHVPLFAIVTWMLWRALGRKLEVAVSIAVAAIAGTELLQIFVGRSVSVSDMLYGVCGCLAAALFILQRTKMWRRWRKAAVILAMLTTLVLPFIHAAPVMVGAITAARDFPVLSDFNTRFQHYRWSVLGGELERAPKGQSSEPIGRLIVPPGKGSKTEAVLFPVVRDWSKYRRLWIEFSFEGPPIDVLFSIRDGRRVEPPAKRFDDRRRFASGTHRISFDLEMLATGVEFSPLDMKRVRAFLFVVDRTDETREIRMHRLYLE